MGLVINNYFPFGGAFPLPFPDALLVVEGQFPPGPGCEEGPLPEFPLLLLFKLFAIHPPTELYFFHLCTSEQG